MAADRQASPDRAKSWNHWGQLCVCKVRGNARERGEQAQTVPALAPRSGRRRCYEFEWPGRWCWRWRCWPRPAEKKTSPMAIPKLRPERPAPRKPFLTSRQERVTLRRRTSSSPPTQAMPPGLNRRARMIPSRQRTARTPRPQTPRLSWRRPRRSSPVAPCAARRRSSSHRGSSCRRTSNPTPTVTSRRRSSFRPDSTRSSPVAPKPRFGTWAVRGTCGLRRLPRLWRNWASMRPGMSPRLSRAAIRWAMPWDRWEE